MSSWEISKEASMPPWPISLLLPAALHRNVETARSVLGCAEIPVRKYSLMVLLTLAKSEKEKHVIGNITNQRLNIDKVWSHLQLLGEIRWAKKILYADFSHFHDGHLNSPCWPIACVPNECGVFLTTVHVENLCVECNLCELCLQWIFFVSEILLFWRNL